MRPNASSSSGPRSVAHAVIVLAPDRAGWIGGRVLPADEARMSDHAREWGKATRRAEA